MEEIDDILDSLYARILALALFHRYLDNPSGAHGIEGTSAKARRIILDNLDFVLACSVELLCCLSGLSL